MKVLTGLAVALGFGCLLSAPAQADHIQYFNYAFDYTVDGGVTLGSGDSWSVDFDLTTDLMDQNQLSDDGSTVIGPIAPGSYDPDAGSLHYVTLIIDPNNRWGNPTSNYLELTVNGYEISDWSNPIRLYDWGVPGGSVDDPYGIVGNDYTVTVSLFGLANLGNNTIEVTNVNLEGCYDTGEGAPSPAPVPEPATLLLFGTGLAGLASRGLKKKQK